MCRELGNGRSGTVYLAYHVELEEYRAVKVVPKSLADYDTFRKEALFLKTLRHPGIPIVYDVEEDTGYSYLIEEYLEGESLYALVKRLGSLSVKAAADLGIQICRIIQFMNSAENPILYLDLQPKNLLVCNGVLRLTDFDHAQYASDAAAFGERYGTIGFAAPEQYTGEPLDCRTDVYAIGALLYFMSRGDAPGSVPEYRNEPEYRMFDRIIRGCMEKEKEARYQSADELQETLQELQNQLKEQAAESRIVVFAGAAAGIGTTHAALGMSHFLTRNGCPALYQEDYDTSAVRTLAKNMGIKTDRTGVYRIGCGSIRPYYGEAVKLPYLYFPVIIKDVGVIRPEEKLPEADFYVLVCGGKWWEIDRTVNAAKILKSRGNVILLFNHMEKKARLKLPKVLSDIHYFFLPFFSNPFREDKAANTCYRDLWNDGTGETRWKRKKLSQRLRRSDAE